MFHGRGGDRRMKSSTHKFLWWVSHRQEAFLNFALMGLVSLPIIVWAIIFLLVISMGHGQALMRLVSTAAAPTVGIVCRCARVGSGHAAEQRDEIAAS
jgi:hypothetical protein